MKALAVTFFFEVASFPYGLHPCPEGDVILDAVAKPMKVRVFVVNKELVGDRAIGLR